MAMLPTKDYCMCADPACRLYGCKTSSKPQYQYPGTVTVPSPTSAPGLPFTFTPDHGVAAPLTDEDVRKIVREELRKMLSSIQP
jgi:hypothetical protein